MKLELDATSKDQETEIQNFFREAKYLILLTKEGQNKTIVLYEEE